MIHTATLSAEAVHFSQSWVLPCGCMWNSDQNAVQIHLLAAVHAGAPEDVSEATRVVHAQDVDVILAAESLNESEVNLKRHIFHIIVVCGQDAQHHVIRVHIE